MSTPQVSEKLLEMVVHRASSDRVFRQQLLAAPAEAIRTAFGVTLPEGFRIRFIEKDPNLDVLVVLPELMGEQELSDDDLEQVAGGTAAAWSGPPPGGTGSAAWSGPGEPPQ